MTDATQPPAAIAAAAPAFVDEAVAAAEGTRTAARWIASALGAIPSLAILASIVRAPGDTGFDATKLAVGVALAAGGAIIGVLGFAWVIAPVPLEDKDVADVDLTRIPGQPFTSFGELNQELARLRRGAADLESRATSSLVAAKRTEALAQSEEAAAKAAEAEAQAAPADTELQARAQATRASADGAAAEAAAAAATAAADSAELTQWQTQVARRDSVRFDAYRLKAASTVGMRYLVARCGAALSVALVAAGVVLLGLAPNLKGAPPAPSPRLVTLTLSKAGQQALGCRLRSLQALQIGGSSSAPAVITLPTPGCPSRAVVFSTTTTKSLGSYSAVRSVGAG
jgi:hypothetical protein